MRSALIAAVAASLAFAPTAATAQGNAAPLSIVGPHQRAGAELQDANSLGGVTFILALIGAAVLIGIFVLLDDDDDKPTSP